jgi:predicted ATPase/class 3 adenylate cyclase
LTIEEIAQMNHLPAGTVTFLFTDIEGSTQLWERQPDRMRAALERHDALLRQAIEQNSGMVFKTVGDAFCAAFDEAADAARAAMEGQRLLAAEAWDLSDAPAVRMALHSGAAQQRDGDYFGPALNRVARLLSVGHGRQILVSLASYGLLKDNKDAAVTFRSLGEHRLKDLLEPEQVWQLCGPGLDAGFPPLRSLDRRRTNLPQQLSSFIGREREMAEVRRLLGTSRLLTLTGSGGTGKTRLGVQVAAEMLDDYPEGAWIADLAPLTDPALVVQAVASALGVQEEPGRRLQATLTESLRDRRLLLLLDNCEHLIATCADLAGTLLAQCGQTRILATSREAMNIPGEQVYRIPSLSLPEVDGPISVDSVFGCEAAQLFLARAHAASASFDVTISNGPAVASICRRLDGIPLAIELAAARVRVLKVEEIDARLDDCFRLLTGGSRAALPRQQTLRALIDWSYELLNEKEKCVFERLAVFAGGWTLEAAEAVCAGENIEEWEVLDLHTALADKSLVLHEEVQGRVSRFRMLETVRQFALEKLQLCGAGPSVRRRHSSYFLGFAELAEPEFLKSEQSAWLASVALEHDNLRGALEACHCDPGLAESELRIAGALRLFWFLSSYLNEGRERLSLALAREEAGTSPACRAKALVGLAILAYFRGDLDAARTACERSQEVADGAGGAWSAAIALILLGILEMYEGRFGPATDYFEACLALAVQSQDLWLHALALSDLGFVALHQGDFARASELCRLSLAMAQEVGEKWCIFNSLYSLGLVTLVGGDFARALGLFKEAMAISRGLGHKISIAHCMDGMAGAWGAQGDTERAALLFGAAAAWRDKIGAAVPPAFRFGYDQNIAAVRQALGEAGFDAKWEEGQKMTFEEAITFALTS